MPFEREKSATPVEIGRMTVTFEVLTAASTAVDRATVGFAVLDAQGDSLKERTHNLLPELTAAQKTTIFNFMSNLRTKAKTEVIP